MSDDETPAMEFRPAVPPEPAYVLSINQIVSYNLMRARRSHGWTQQDVATLLEKYTGRTWSNASVSAAERAWQGGRPRRFDASEIVAMAKIFDEPIAYFFIPPEDQDFPEWVGMKEFEKGKPRMSPADNENDLMAILPTAELVEMAGIPRDAPADFVTRMQELSMRWLPGLMWNAPEWRFILRELRSAADLARLEHAPADEFQRVQEEAKRQIDAEFQEAKERGTEEFARKFQEFREEARKRAEAELYADGTDLPKVLRRAASLLETLTEKDRSDEAPPEGEEKENP